MHALHEDGSRSEVHQNGPAKPVLDLHLFASLQEMLDAPTLARMYGELIAQTRSRLDALLAGISPRSVSELAHSMHGATAMLGAASLAEGAASLERQPSSEALPKIVEAMRLDCFALENVLREQKVRV